MSISKEIDEIKFPLKKVYRYFFRDLISSWKHRWSRLSFSLFLASPLRSICTFLRKKIFMFRNGK